MRTPGEWWTMPDPSDGSFAFCVKGSGTPFAKIEFMAPMRFKEEEGNAEFICKAVNSHDLLVKLLEDGIWLLDRGPAECLGRRWAEKAREELRKTGWEWPKDRLKPPKAAPEKVGKLI